MDVNGILLSVQAVKNANLNSQIGVAVLEKEMQSDEQTGAAITKMMEASVNPSVGQNIDIRL